MLSRTQLVKELLIAAKETKRTIQKKSSYLFIPDIVVKLADEIIQRKYQPSSYTCFVVKDPNPREILAPAYRDRIVHRWLVNKLEAHFDKRWMDCAYANRKGKGHHKAVEKLQCYLHNYEYTYYLKSDIKSFFNTIHHHKLIEIVDKWIDMYTNYSEEEKLLLKYVSKKIITHNPTQNVKFTGNKSLHQLVPGHKSYFNNPPGIGLPLGNLTSQFFAQMYLNELDYFVKHQLKVRYYLRYVDDFVILGKSSEELKNCLEQIQSFLRKELYLELHPQKIRINKCKTGIDFCGYIVWSKSIIVRPRVVQSFRKKLNFFKYLISPKEGWKFQIYGNNYIEKHIFI